MVRSVSAFGGRQKTWKSGPWGAVALCAQLLVGSTATADPEAPERTTFTAVRATAPMVIDGILDEPDWQRAPPFENLVQSYPTLLAPPSQQTRVRVLYDDHALYVSVLCLDSEPEKIVRPLGRRDATPDSDMVYVGIDSDHDHRNAKIFFATAGGILRDDLAYDDSQMTTTWDAVWEGAVQVRADGWAAEFSIPLTVLHFPDAPEQQWGFHVGRYLARKHEFVDTVPLPPDSPSVVSRFGHLVGLQGLRPAQSFWLVPFVANRWVLRPLDVQKPEVRVLDPVLDLGADFRLSLGSRLTLNGALAPDFGQVEADSAVLNLSTYELFLPEKRPFFLEGMELFQAPPNFDSGSRTGSLFYSRRLGSSAPILGAAKLSGTLSEGIQVGALDAVMLGEGRGSGSTGAEDRSYRFHPLQPLHLAPEGNYPAEPPPPTQVFVGALRAFGENSSVRGMITSSLPLSGPCLSPASTGASAEGASGCAASGGNTAGLDAQLHSPGKDFEIVGQVLASQVQGGPRERTLRDGTLLRSGDLGVGTAVDAGKHGGDGFRFNLGYELESPKLELNAAGYLAAQNHQQLHGSATFIRPNGLGRLRSLNLTAGAIEEHTSDGRIHLGRELNGYSAVVLPGFQTAACYGAYRFPVDDVREISQSGLALERPANAYLTCELGTDPAGSWSLRGKFSGSRVFTRVSELGPGAEAGLGMTVRPGPWLSTSVDASWSHQHQPARSLGYDPQARYFGDLLTSDLSVTLRQNVLLSPRLSLQLFVQLFSAFGQFTRFFAGPLQPEGGRVRLADLEEVANPGATDFHASALKLNLTFRWEYRSGSTLYVVYARSQAEAAGAQGEASSASLAFPGLWSGPATDALFFKWSHGFELGG